MERARRRFWTLAVPGGEVRLVDAWFERREVEWLS